MAPASFENKHVVFRCDLGKQIGTGHVFRCLSLAEELTQQGARVSFVLDEQAGADVPFARDAILAKGFPLHEVWSLGRAPVRTPDGTPRAESSPEAKQRAAAAHVELFEQLQPDAVVWDSYTLPAEIYQAVRETGVPTMAIVDHENHAGGPATLIGNAVVDLYVDPDPGAEHVHPELPNPDGKRVAGLNHMMLRDGVINLRPPAPPAPAPPTGRPPQVLMVFGGNDAFGAGPHMVEAIATTGEPFDALLVAPDDDLRRAALDVPLREGQTLEVRGSIPGIENTVARADLVVGAAGTSTWETACLGKPQALITVAPNQGVCQRMAVQGGAAVDLGSLDEVKQSAGRPGGKAVEGLKRVLRDPGLRADLGAAGYRLVTPEGRQNTAAELAKVMAGRTRSLGQDGAERLVGVEHVADHDPARRMLDGLGRPGGVPHTSTRPVARPATSPQAPAPTNKPPQIGG